LSTQARSGAEGATSAGASGKKFTLCADVEAAADAVKKIVTPETVVLFKGSRGIQLEKAVDMLVAR
jgi:UDP-N-acetylmuramyl pentapeptide synthase